MRNLLSNLSIVIILILTTTFCKPKEVTLVIENISDKIASTFVGDNQLWLLSEGDQKGRPSILIGATDQMLSEYMPEGTFPNACNAFLLKVGEEYILFDTGFGRELFNNLETIGVKTEEIAHLFLTHLHGDHIGGMIKEAELSFPNAKIYLAKQEYDYWMGEAESGGSEEVWKRRSETQRRVLEAYSQSTILIEPQPLPLPKGAKEVLKGVSAIESYGHTPGHTSYLITSGKDSLLIWGDLTHAMAIQMPHPEISVTYDTDPVEAAASRLKILDYLAKNKIKVAGMHIPYPAIGRVSEVKEGGYDFHR